MTVPSGPIRVAIVDDHPVVREGTAALLDAQAGLRVVGTASSIEEASSLLDPSAVDVLLLDIRLGADSGLALLGGTAPRPAIVVLTAYDYPQYVAAALRLGASGFVIKTAPVPELVDAIRRAAAGGLAFGRRPDAAAASLTPREARSLGSWSTDAAMTRLGPRSGSRPRRSRAPAPAFRPPGGPVATELATGRCGKAGWKSRSWSDPVGGRGQGSEARPERMKRSSVSPSAGALAFRFPSIPLWEELSVMDGHERAAGSQSEAESGPS